jgi:hypothetical protein
MHPPLITADVQRRFDGDFIAPCIVTVEKSCLVHHEAPIPHGLFTAFACDMVDERLSSAGFSKGYPTCLVHAPLLSAPTHAALAQLVEHRIRNAGVTGSSPVGGTIVSSSNVFDDGLRRDRFNLLRRYGAPDLPALRTVTPEIGELF